MKSKKMKLITTAIILVAVFSFIGIFAYNQSVFASRTIVGNVDSGEHKLYVNCIGKGNPTIVFEAGLGGNYMSFGIVQKELSKTNRAFSYTRFTRIRQITPKDTLRTSMDQVKELHSLLGKAKVKGPYIIVAHSMGGYNARLFATSYPKEVVGIVFVDSSHESQNDSVNADPVKVKEMTEAYAGGEQTYEEVKLSARQVKETRKKDALRNIPIIVLTADKRGFEPAPGYNEKWLNYQKDIASLSNDGKHIMVKNSGHFIQIDQSKAVIDAIKEILGKL